MNESEVTLTQMLNNSQNSNQNDSVWHSENRFSVLACGQDGQDGGQWTTITRTGKRRWGNRESVDSEKFSCLNTDEKLNVLFEKLTSVELAQEDVKQFHEAQQRTNDRLDSIQDAVNENKDELLQLRYKMLHMETLYKQNNMLVYGLEETSHDEGSIYDTVSNFLYDYLQLDLEEMDIENIVRLGNGRGYGRFQDRRIKRPVLITFRYKDSVDMCIKKSFYLSGTEYAIDRDYPFEIQQARKRIWPEYKKLRDEKNSRVRILYPAAISVDGTILHDQFPGWDRLVYGRDRQLVNRSQIRSGSLPRSDVTAVPATTAKSNSQPAVSWVSQSTPQPMSNLRPTQPEPVTTSISTGSASQQPGSASQQQSHLIIQSASVTNTRHRPAAVKKSTAEISTDVNKSTPDRSTSRPRKSRAQIQNNSKSCKITQRSRSTSVRSKRSVVNQPISNLVSSDVYTGGGHKQPNDSTGVSRKSDH